MKKIILGIDPGTRSSGYGILVFENGDLRALDFGAIRPPPSAPLSKRYKILFDAVEDLIEKYSPDEVAIESQFVHKSIPSAMKLGMARGMIMLAAERKEIPLFEYTPKKAKLAVAGHGNAGKEQVQKMIQLLLRLPHVPEPHDAADALALAICHTHNIGKKAHV